MTVMLEDGRRTSQHSWMMESLSGGKAVGYAVNPLMHSLNHRRGHKTADRLVRDAQSAGAWVLLDPMTHMVTLSGATHFGTYADWGFWGGAQGDLSTAALRMDHLKRVFDAQALLGVASMGPTVTLDSPTGPSATRSIDLSSTALTLDSAAYLSLAGTRALWGSGPSLDALVGVLNDLEASTWVLSFVRDNDMYPPDATDVAAEVGFLRTVTSLAQRSTVIVTHADVRGINAIAAGASFIGSGWDRSQRILDRSQVQPPSSGFRRSGIKVAHTGLMASLPLRSAMALDRADAAVARILRGGRPVPTDLRQDRSLHLEMIWHLSQQVSSMPLSRERTALLAAMYDQAASDWDQVRRLATGIVAPSEKAVWLDTPRAALRVYALEEGF